MALDLEVNRIKTQEATTVELVSMGGDGVPPLSVTGFLISDIGVSGSNEFANYFDDSAAGSAIKGVTSTIEKVGANFAGKTWKFEDFGMTALSYAHSSRFSINVDLLVVEVDDNDNSINTARQLLRTVYPERGEKGSILAPLRYEKGIQSDLRQNALVESKGGIGIKISTWFETTPIFLVDSVSESFSRVVTDTGRPLWMSASVSLTSSVMNDINEVLSWFKESPL